MSVEVLSKHIFEQNGEGPHWDEDTQALYFVDNFAKTVFSWNYGTQEVTQVHLEQNAGFIVPREKGGFAIGYGKALSSLDWKTKEVTTLVEVDKDADTRINDGKCDARGRVWFGTFGVDLSKREQGSLYCLHTDGSTVKKHMDKISMSNGLAWTADNKRMFYVDSIPGKVYGFDYDIETGIPSNRKVAIDFEAIGTLGLPDGITIDTEDKLWVACYDGAKVVRFDPETGKQLQTIDFQAKKITSCCFGGPNHDELFVTCGKVGASEQELDEYPLSGSLFRVTGLGVKGTKSRKFKDFQAKKITSCCFGDPNHDELFVTCGKVGASMLQFMS